MKPCHNFMFYIYAKELYTITYYVVQQVVGDGGSCVCMRDDGWVIRLIITIIIIYIKN